MPPRPDSSDEEEFIIEDEEFLQESKEIANQRRREWEERAGDFGWNSLFDLDLEHDSDE